MLLGGAKKNTKGPVQTNHVWDINTNGLASKASVPRWLSMTQRTTVHKVCNYLLFFPPLNPSIHIYSWLRPCVSAFPPLQKNSLAHSVTQRTLWSSTTFVFFLFLFFCRIPKNDFQLPAKINVFLFRSQGTPFAARPRPPNRNSWQLGGVESVWGGWKPTRWFIRWCLTRWVTRRRRQMAGMTDSAVQAINKNIFPRVRAEYLRGHTANRHWYGGLG